MTILQHQIKGPLSTINGKLLVTPHLRQAWFNVVILPIVKATRRPGFTLEGSVFKAPKIESDEDIEKIRLLLFEDQWRLAGISRNYADPMDQRPFEHFAQAKATFVEEAPGYNHDIWKITVQNVKSEEDPTPLDDTVVARKLVQYDPTFYLKEFERQPNTNNGCKGTDRVWKLAKEKYHEHPDTHALKFIWAMECQGGESQPDKARQAEMISRTAHALVTGRDLGGNFGGASSILSPNIYHHFGDMWTRGPNP